MHHIWRNRIYFGVTLLGISLFWLMAGPSWNHLPVLLVSSLACTFMYFYTTLQLRHLDEQRRLLDQIVQNLPGAVFWKDAASRYQGCNGYFAKFAGCSTPCDLIGKTEFDLHWKKSEAKRYHLSDLQVMQSREPIVNVELSYRTREGNRVILLANKVPLLDEKGNVSGVLGMFQDISAQKELERELADAKKLESLGQLSAGVAHEINTPMQCIMLNISFIKDSYERLSRVVGLLPECLPFADQETRSKISAAMKSNRFEFCCQQIPLAIDEADEASRRVVDVVSAMKYLAHPNRDQRHPLDINLLIRNAATISRKTWKTRANIEFDFENGLAQIPGLQGALTQVLINLISNACDAIEMAGRGLAGRLDIRTRSVKEGVLIDVHDNGIGIPEELTSRVFDPFFTTKDVGKGTGQGLAISHDVIVNRHAGRITLDSTPGEGTTFSIWLPYESADLKSQNAVEPAILCLTTPSSSASVAQSPQ